MRGVYAAGIFDCCLENAIQFDLCIGVSAGSANVCAYMAGQKKRNFIFYTEYAFRKQYMGIGNFLLKRSFIDLDYVYGTLSNSDGENPLDQIGLAMAYNKVNKDIYIRAITDTFGDIPFEVANDGDVSALAGMLSLGEPNVLGIAMGTSEAVGFVDAEGRITGWLNELAFVPVDAAPDAMRDEWSGDIGWTRAAYPVAAGTHTYQWTYSKDYYGTSGHDCAYLDAISFPCGKVNVPAGIHDFSLKTNTLQVWPNPATDFIHVIAGDNAGNATYRLYDLNGRLLQGGRLTSSDTRISVAKYVSGTYILQVEDSTHQIQTTKIIKK